MKNSEKLDNILSYHQNYQDLVYNHHNIVELFKAMEPSIQLNVNEAKSLLLKISEDGYLNKDGNSYSYSGKSIPFLDKGGYTRQAELLEIEESKLIDTAKVARWQRRLFFPLVIASFLISLASLIITLIKD